jgi:hypothetical protein
MDPEEIREIFMDVVGYDPDEMAKGGEVKNRMKKPVKKSNGGMMNKYKSSWSRRRYPWYKI